jgi:hypothetical protein
VLRGVVGARRLAEELELPLKELRLVPRMESLRMRRLGLRAIHTRPVVGRGCRLAKVLQSAQDMDGTRNNEERAEEAHRFGRRLCV